MFTSLCHLPTTNSITKMDNLPPHVLTSIISKLPFKKKFQVQRVCQSWRDASQHAVCCHTRLIVQDPSFRFFREDLQDTRGQRVPRRFISDRAFRLSLLSGMPWIESALIQVPFWSEVISDVLTSVKILKRLDVISRLQMYLKPGEELHEPILERIFESPVMQQLHSLTIKLDAQRCPHPSRIIPRHQRNLKDWSDPPLQELTIEIREFFNDMWHTDPVISHYVPQFQRLKSLRLDVDLELPYMTHVSTNLAASLIHLTISFGYLPTRMAENDTLEVICRRCPQLQTLIVNHPSVTDRPLRSVARLHHLNTFMLLGGSSQLTEEGIYDFCMTRKDILAVRDSPDIFMNLVSSKESLRHVWPIELRQLLKSCRVTITIGVAKHDDMLCSVRTNGGDTKV